MENRATRGKTDNAGNPDERDAAPPLDMCTLVVNHHGDVYRYAFRLAGSQADAEDLTQQTFLVAQQRLAQLRDPAKAPAWLFAILRTCYLKSRRKRRPIDATGIELDVESIPEAPSREEIDCEALQQAIDALPDEFKLVLVMFYFEGCSYKEIAAELDIPMGTVMSRLTRAKSRLRGRLLRDGTDRGQGGSRSAIGGIRETPAFASRARKGHRPVGR